MKKMKKILAIMLCLCMVILFASCGKKTDTDGANKGSDEVKDWMVDQAQGKDYGQDDGGSYYCMGKNDTCTNKTKNAYDLYCNSCDPDGDNVEG